jgi:hypothetical protein
MLDLLHFFCLVGVSVEFLFDLLKLVLELFENFVLNVLFNVVRLPAIDFSLHFDVNLGLVLRLGSHVSTVGELLL